MIEQPEVKFFRNANFKKILIGLVLVVIFFIGAAWIWSAKIKKSAYTIPGVAYYSIWNHRGDNVFSGETAAAVFSVLDYWDRGKIKPMEVEKFFKFERAAEKKVELESIKKYVDLTAKNRYAVELVLLRAEELKNYINSKDKSPLLAYLPISPEQPIGLNYQPLVTVIGVDEVREKIIVHDFWLGNNREISFADLDLLWGKVKPAARNKYLLIRPVETVKNLAEINSREVTEYPERLPLMAKNEVMIKSYVLGMGSQTDLDYESAKKFLLSVKNNSNFQNDFVPVLKVQVLARLAAIELKDKNLPVALDYVQKAIEADHDLDRPLANGWPGYEHARESGGISGQSSDPYRVLGNIYKSLGEKGKAVNAYKKALEINPDLPSVADELKNLL